MSSAEVVGMGWHDTYFRWDISTPQRVVSRLQELPGQGSLIQPGKKLYAERDRFGKWDHLLGPQNVMLSYTVRPRKTELIRRLEVQAHLGREGEDDLCRPSEFESGYKRLEAFMAMLGVLPPEDPVCVRLDAAVDVTYGDPREAQQVLEALRFARWPGQWYAEFQGPHPTPRSPSGEGRRSSDGSTAGTPNSETPAPLGEAAVRERATIHVARGEATRRVAERDGRVGVLGRRVRPGASGRYGDEN